MGDQLISSSSTSNLSVEFGGITGGKPRAPYACADDPTAASLGGQLAPAGSGLLPNLARASLNGYLLDGAMMGMLNAQERTYAEMDALTRAAGWKISSVKRAVGSLWSYVTAEAI